MGGWVGWRSLLFILLLASTQCSFSCPCLHLCSLSRAERGVVACLLASCRFGALSGVLATLTFPALQRTLGLVLTGAAAVWAQLLCLLCATLPALASLLGAPLPNRGVLLALVWGLVLSRFGLWTFDLIVNQLIQETVDHSMLGELGLAGGWAKLRMWGGGAAGQRACLGARWLGTTK